MIRFIGFLLCCWLSFPANAQKSTVRKAQHSFEQAQPFLLQGNTDEGIRYLTQAIQADPKFQAAYIQLGDLYRYAKNPEKAKENYRNAIASAAIVNPKIFFLSGEAELLTGDYAEAKRHFEQFQQNDQIIDKEAQVKAKKYISDCDFALSAIRQAIPYHPINMGSAINSSDRDYFPALTADGETLIFSRVVNGNEDFYVGQKKNNNWQQSIPLSTAINTASYNEGAQSISPDGKYLFFTGCNRPDGFGSCDIYVSHKQGFNWGKPFNLGKVLNSEYWDSQPAISPDGKTLYFASNRPGGMGGYDVWKSTLDENFNWTKPQNLGPEINTAYDESTPFMHADGKTFYFSSDGWPGMGNKDIFFSRLLADGHFSEPQNLGYPINTFNEESGLIVSADGSEGLFSSDLEGGYGGLDIYRFKMPQNLRPLPLTYIKGIVRDRATQQTLTASVLINNLTTHELLYNAFTNYETGDFMAVMPRGDNYSFHIQAEGYNPYSQYFELKEGSADRPFEIEIDLDKIEIGSGVTLNNIFFETNKFELLPSSMVELYVLLDFLSSNPIVSIEIQGHTDNLGDEGSNQRLSENRARSVYNFLVSKGISVKRLSYKGYGENKPRFDNTTEDGRKQNRRTEFIVTKS